MLSTPWLAAIDCAVAVASILFITYSFNYLNGCLSKPYAAR
ncbi:hypothetical protein [Piscirickettsia salmonis]|nr:hypothetical protein [Piscirickettsia salmonis]